MDAEDTVTNTRNWIQLRIGIIGAPVNVRLNPCLHMSWI